MSTVSIAVMLKSPDPAAVTALATLGRVLPADCPLKLHRFERWEFSGPDCRHEAVSTAVGHFDDIVNPNKQAWVFLESGPLPGDEPTLVWRSVVVTDREDSLSENWTSILSGKGFPFERVVHSILWRLGFSAGTQAAEASRRSIAVAVTSSREGGLLANPVSQSVRVSEPV
jgi:hypothetical protein